MTAPAIAAIICTHNRDAYLGAAIDSLLAQDCEAAGIPFEIVVVDNASRDRTREVVAAREGDPRLRYVYEPVAGLSVARNTGARSAQAPLLAYLDDDAEASPQWLRELHGAFAAHPNLAIAGGKVTLRWPDGRSQPPWMSEAMLSPLGSYDLGDRLYWISDPGWTPRGLNYGIRRSFLDTVGGFDPNLGRVGKKLLSNEEMVMTELALDRGWQVAYVPAALAAHHVAPERMEPRWFLERSWWQGVSEAYRERAAGRTGWRQLGRGGERLLRGTVKAAKFWRDRAARFDNFTYAYGQIGYLLSAVRSWLPAPNPIREASPAENPEASPPDPRPATQAEENRARSG